MTNQIAARLTEALQYFGIKNEDERTSWIDHALAYLKADREHYIEVAEQGTPEYLITVNHGLICRLLPLAQKVETEYQKSRTATKITVFSLMLTDTVARFVLDKRAEYQDQDPSKNAYSFPTYYYAQPTDLDSEFQLLPARQIRPAATPLQREMYGMMFTAFAKLGKNLSINSIPHKTERAMLAAEHTPEAEILLDGKPVTGKRIPLASAHSMWSEPREDHNYSYSKELCLFLNGEKPQYILRTTHIYSYFRKVVIGDDPDACVYEPNGEKQETTYQTVSLSDIAEDLHPLYY